MTIKIDVDGTTKEERSTAIVFNDRETGEDLFEFFFSLDDDNIQRFYENRDKVDEGIKNIQKNEDNSQFIPKTREILRDIYNALLGEGSFDAIYEKVPSVILLLEYLAPIQEGIAKEINKKTSGLEKQANKYRMNK